MRPTCTLVPAAQLIRLRYQGATTYEQWAEALEAALADPARGGEVDLLLDRRGITEPPSTQTVQRAVEFFERHHTDIRRVASVVEDGAVYGMFRMLEALSERTAVQVRSFKNYEGATEWLGEAVASALAREAVPDAGAEYDLWSLERLREGQALLQQLHHSGKIPDGTTQEWWHREITRELARLNAALVRKRSADQGD